MKDEQWKKGMMRTWVGRPARGRPARFAAIAREDFEQVLEEIGATMGELRADPIKRAAVAAYLTGWIVPVVESLRVQASHVTIVYGGAS